MPAFRRSRKEPKSRFIKIENHEAETRRLMNEFWTDLYHQSMTGRWPTFFGSAAQLIRCNMHPVLLAPASPSPTITYFKQSSWMYSGIRGRCGDPNDK
jgi:hypothetical protein